MPAQVKKSTLRAEKLLKTPHPKHPTRNYTIQEAAKKTGIARSTLYRHLEKLEVAK